MKTTFIENAINNGGILSLGQNNAGELEAMMSWPDLVPYVADIDGRPATTITQALENLDEALCDDCAEEMMAAGQA